MYRDKKFLAIIPARSGSKGIINKNIKLLNGKHLIGYSIEAAINSGIFEDVLVSTDSKEYADISRGYGAYVPFLRSKELSSDTAKTEDVIKDVINRLKNIGKEYDYFVLLQATSPLRDKNDIIKAVDLLLDSKSQSVVSVCEVEYSPKLVNVLDDSMSMFQFIKKDDNKRRQDLEKYYRINGAIYISSINSYLQYGNFYIESSKAYIMEQEKSIDIDSEVDFILAEVINKNM